MGMNYLAHAYLSFNHPEILLGNMISDEIKGKQIEQYNELVQHGIRLHRNIDAFTDDHPATRRGIVLFKPHYRLYAGAFIDVVYDHFLALDTSIFPSPDHLMAFSASTYSLLEKNISSMPIRFKGMFPHMQSQNWLYHYRFKEGIRNSFAGLVKRAAYMHDSAPAWEVFNREYDALQSIYQQFFPDLKAHVVNLTRPWINH